MINSISFIVLTRFFQLNELKILRQPGYLLQVKPTIFFYSVPKTSHFFIVHLDQISLQKK